MAEANIDQFDTYFRRADANKDGKISGAEAIAFFQGSNLPKQVLAQIWMYTDKGGTGFLGRGEFYDALKLVTVAQSKRELTPETVKLALYGPAAAKIPAPRINFLSPLPSQANPLASGISMQPGAVVSQSTHNMGVGFHTHALPSSSVRPSDAAVMPSSQNFNFGVPYHPVPVRPVVQSGAAMDTTQLARSPLSSVVGLQYPSTLPNQLARPSPSSAVRLQYPSTLPNQLVRSSLSSTVGLQYPSTLPNQLVGSSLFSAVGPQHPSTLPNQLVRPPLSSTVGWQHPSTSYPQPVRPSLSSTVGNTLQFPQEATIESFMPAVTTHSFRSMEISSDSLAGKAPLGMASSIRGLIPLSSPAISEVLASVPQLSIQDSKQISFSGDGVTATGEVRGPTTSFEPSVQSGLFSAAQSASPQSSAKSQSLDSIDSVLAVQTSRSQYPQPNSPINSNQKVSAYSSSSFTPPRLPSSSVNLATGQSFSAFTPPRLPLSSVNPTTSQSFSAWPKFGPANIQKYTKVFLEVDTDKDAKITGEQARNLFFSWKFPREVLKQVWDLSDQDNDSMLSLKEFCIALYLMERFREGHALPALLPDAVSSDEALLTMTAQPALEQAVPVHSVRGHSQHLRPFQAAAVDTGGVRAESGERVLDSKEKMEFYCRKMQELILYKSRCENRLNEMAERALAEKHEAESAAKKYQDKYGQVGDIARKVTEEEARLVAVEGRKGELTEAILRMHGGGTIDGILQVRADRIHSDVEELMNLLNDVSNKHGLDAKPTEFPRGWQPGPAQLVAEWDEDWEKFEDAGFSSLLLNSSTSSDHDRHHSHLEEDDDDNGTLPVSHSSASSPASAHRDDGSLPGSPPAKVDVSPHVHHGFYDMSWDDADSAPDSGNIPSGGDRDFLFGGGGHDFLFGAAGDETSLPPTLQYKSSPSHFSRFDSFDAVFPASHTAFDSHPSCDDPFASST